MGDEIMAAGQARRLYEENPQRRVAICDCDGTPRWHRLWAGNPILATPEDVAGGEPVQKLVSARDCRPYVRYPFTVEHGMRFNDWQARHHVGRLYLTEAERQLGTDVRADIGPFVVVEPSPIVMSVANKRWPFERFAELVARCGDVHFVQMIHRYSRPLPGARHIATESFRDGCGVLHAAAAYVGSEGGLHHAAAALDVRAVVIFGGCISVHATGYDTHVNLVDDGPESPCGSYLPCEHCRAAMERITVAQVASALESQLFIDDASSSRSEQTRVL